MGPATSHHRMLAAQPHLARSSRKPEAKKKLAGSSLLGACKGVCRMHKRSPIKHDMTRNCTTSALGAGGGTFPSAQSSSLSTTFASASFVVVWPSLVLALTSIAITCAVVNINDASSSQSKYSPPHRNEWGGRGFLAQIGLLVCATVLHASSIWRSQRDESFSFNADATSKTGNDDIPPDPQAVLNASVFLKIFVNIVFHLAAVSWNEYHSSTITAKYRYCHVSTDTTRSISIANLGPVVYSILPIMESRGNGKARNLHNYNQWHMAMVSYVLVLLVAQFLQRLIKKRRGQRSVLAGIPLANGYAHVGDGEGARATMPPPRPDRWHEWSAEEVSDLVSSLPQLGSSGPNSMAYNDGFSIGRSKFKSRESNQHYASLLREECVDGMALAGMSIEALRSFGIPYGHAKALRRTIDSELVSRYGIGDLQLNGDALRHNGTLLDSSTSTMEGRSDVPSAYEGAATLVDKIDPDMAEKASELFAERFGGMKLANFETGESSTASSGVSQSDPTRQKVGLVGDSSVLDTVEEEGVGVGGVGGDEQHASPVPPPSAQLSEALLSSLPRNVREVAMRRPELFRTMLRNRGIGAAGAGVANDSAPVAAGSGTSEIEMALHWADDDDDEEASSSDMVGLLRRRSPR